MELRKYNSRDVRRSLPALKISAMQTAQCFGILKKKIVRTKDKDRLRIRRHFSS